MRGALLRSRECGCGPAGVAALGAGARRPGGGIGWGTPRSLLRHRPHRDRGHVRRAPNRPRSRSRSELEDSASIFSSSAIPVYDTMTPDDLDARPEQDGSEASWEAAFAAFPRPFGGAGATGPAEEPTRCGALPGCESAYYAVEKEGVWVLVLDDSQHGDVNQAQREWVERRLGAAGAEAKPVIVVANANLGAQIAAHDIEASRLLAALVGENPDGRGRRRALRRLGLLLRRPRSQRPGTSQLQRAPARRVRVGHARLRAALHPGRGRLPRREGHPPRPRPHDRTQSQRRSAGVGAADPRDRRTGARSQRRDAAAPQQRVDCSKGWRAARARAAGPAKPARRSAQKTSTRRSPRCVWCRAARPPCCPNTNSNPPIRKWAASSSATPPPATRAKCCRTPKANRSPTNGKRASRRWRSRASSAPSTPAPRPSRSGQAASPPRCRSRWRRAACASRAAPCR